jgi:hypothetical protein
MANIVEAPTFDETVTVPDDGAARTIGSLLPALEVITDRTRYLKVEQDAGARFNRRVLSLPALKALTGMVDGESRLVDGFGLYQYFAAAVDATLEPLIVVPTSAPGRWKHSQIATAVANGFASLDTDGKVKRSQLRGFLSHGFDCVTSGVPSTPTTYTVSATGVVGATLLLTAPVVPGPDGVLLDSGDHLIASCSLSAKLGTAADVTFLIELETALDAVLVGGMSGDLSAAEFRTQQSFKESGRFLLDGDSVVQAKLLAFAATPGTVIIKNPLAFSVHLTKFKG